MVGYEVDERGKGWMMQCVSPDKKVWSYCKYGGKLLEDLDRGNDLT